MTGAGRREAPSEESALAEEELAAETLLGAALPRIAVTRSYYAVFHGIRARLYVDRLEPRSQGGAQQLFNLHFVKTGVYDAATSRVLARLQKFREEADYAKAFVVDEAGARDEIAAARELVATIRDDVSAR